MCLNYETAAIVKQNRYLLGAVDDIKILVKTGEKWLMEMEQWDMEKMTSVILLRIRLDI